MISFTFDDFPRSALREGGAILRKYGFAGTYYTAFGLMGRETSPVGPLFERGDLARLLADGHEMGCHTFAHCDAWKTAPPDFEKSILDNQRALTELAPGASFPSLSYPVSNPRPDTKRRAGRHFPCCRGGGQTCNSGWADLNLLCAFFLEQSVRDPAQIADVIRRTEEQNGWLIFATHDVSPTPTRFGVTPDFFENAVRAAAGSRCRVLRVREACEAAFGQAASARTGEETLPRLASPTAPPT
jgi:peptidoglycan/xylan/chitin deacetylase (PgdA/CDA1 family)